MSVYSTQAPTLDNTLGAVFLGVVVSCILFGVSALQVYYYYHYYPNDSSLHKLSVALLWVLDITHLSLSIAAAYHYGVSGFGRQEGLGMIIWPVKLQILINVVIVLLVQSLYAYRVWLLSGYHHGVLGYLVRVGHRRGLFSVVLARLLSLSLFFESESDITIFTAIGIVLSYETYVHFPSSISSLFNFPIPLACMLTHTARYTISTWIQAARVAWAVEASFAASTAIDMIISVAMCYYLRKSMGGERVLNSRISGLMQYSLSCGVFTSACSLSCLFTFILMPNNLVFLALSYLLTRLYVNSFLAMMNARDRGLRRSSSTLALSPSHSIPISSVAFMQNAFATSPSRFTSDLESLPTIRPYSTDKYAWVDVPVPELSLSSVGTYTPRMTPAPVRHSTQHASVRVL
ncbi:hypothetical protein DFH08DRAFT_1082017 [Mycena albidolilacea]|uniref:DUF6534 domain-containing protein n=1 Tax=Mycena albidolilacea TaxID=1033008 RepID=A0AAD7EPT9_9AGAR|nr:hypothetical protein DFH08DRAFT_1082017 [Mycena albidolilacea]